MTDSAVAQRGSRAAHGVLLLATLLLLVWAVQFYRTIVTNHDVSWMFTAARRLLEGGRYGADLYEFNTPGALLSYAPAVWLGKVTGWPVQTSLAVYIVTLTAGSLGLIGWLLQRELGPAGLRLRDAFVLFAAAVLLAVPRYDFAQREHLIVILMLPYCLTGSLIGVGERRATALRGIAAFLAAVAITIKPTYVPFPILLMALQARRQGLKSVFTSIELRVFVISGVVYLAAIRLLFPEWIEIARWAVQLYPAFMNPDYFSPVVLRGLALTVPPLLLGVFLNYRFIGPRNPGLYRWINAVLLFAAFALLLFVGQKKGWSYHLLPVKLILGVALGAGLVALVRSYARPKLEAAVVLVLGFLTATLTWLSFVQLPKPSKQGYLEDELVQAVDRLATTRVVAAFSTAIGPFFPMVTELKLGWGSRFSNLWPYPGIRAFELLDQASPTQQRRKVSPADLRALEAQVVGMIAADLDRYRPSLVIVDESASKQSLDAGFDFLARLSQYADFRTAWRPYTRVGKSGDLGLYQRAP